MPIYTRKVATPQRVLFLHIVHKTDALPCGNITYDATNFAWKYLNLMRTRLSLPAMSNCNFDL